MELNNTYKFDFDIKVIFSEILEITLKLTNIKNIKEFYVNITNNEEIGEINFKTRNKEAPTDVLTFRFDDNNNYNPIQGEIYISYEKALSQSIDYKHSFKREICFLFTHGLLHLLGYDHLNNEDEKVMFSLQDKILEGFIF